MKRIEFKILGNVGIPINHNNWLLGVAQYTLLKMYFILLFMHSSKRICLVVIFGSGKFVIVWCSSFPLVMLLHCFYIYKFFSKFPVVPLPLICCDVNCFFFSKWMNGPRIIGRSKLNLVVISCIFSKTCPHYTISVSGIWWLTWQ